MPPANIVPVKKVKLNKTMEIENTPLRPEAGASTSGKSLLFDIVKPLSGYLNGYATNSKRYAKNSRAEVTQ